jgi:hypothetical protein
MDPLFNKIPGNGWGNLLLINGINIKIELDSTARNLLIRQRETINIQYNLVANLLLFKIFTFTDL